MDKCLQRTAKLLALMTTVTCTFCTPVLYAAPTAAVVANDATIKKVDKPCFSRESGFYKDAFLLEIATTTASGVKIYYTTDGSVPTNESTCYEGEILIQNRTNEPNVLASKTGIGTLSGYIPNFNIDKSTVIRAIAYDEEGNASEVVTKTYFVGMEMEKYNHLPIISIVTDPDNLFDYNTGIYVQGATYDQWIANGGDPNTTNSWELPGNYTQEGRTWERPVHIDYFEGDGSLGFSQDLGMRIMGGGSRSYEQKSLKFFAREEYGKKNVKYPLIPGLTKEVDDTTPLTTFKTFVLRNGGNDNFYAKLRDPYFQSLVEDRNIETQGARPVIVFIDGEYWGLYSLNEDYSDDYIKNNYNIDKDNVVMIKRGKIEEGTEKDKLLYDELISFAKNNDLSVAKNYDELSHMMDIQSFIDFCATEIYLGNEDWINYNNNYRLWRSRTTSSQPYEDGKWRWMIYDTEYSLDLYNLGKNYEFDAIQYIYDWGEIGQDYFTQIVLFEALMQNEDFKEQFVTTFMDLANLNFEPNSASNKLDEIVAQYSPCINDSFYRFGPDFVVDYCVPQDYFNEQVDAIRSALYNRNHYVPNMLKKHFDLEKDPVDVTITTNTPVGGSVKINTIQPDFSNCTWTGKYFTDYPITVTAIPAEGYHFIGWLDDVISTEQTITVNFDQAIHLKAQFMKDYRETN